MTTEVNAARVRGTGDDGGVAVIEADAAGRDRTCANDGGEADTDCDPSGEGAPSKLSDVVAGDRGQCHRLGGKLPQ